MVVMFTRWTINAGQQGWPMKSIIAGVIFFLFSIYASTPSVAQTCNGAVICPVQLTTLGSGIETGVSTNDQEFVYVSVGNIVSNSRGILAQGRDPDINAGGEVVYVKEIVGSDGKNRPQIFSTLRGQLTNIEDPNAGGATDPSINSLGEVVYMARDSQNQVQIFSTIRGQLIFVTGETGLSSLEHPEIDDNGRVVFSLHGLDTNNIWEVDTAGNLIKLTFFDYPLKAVQPTLAAETGELVYVLFNEQTDVLSLISERDGELFVADPDPGANFGVYPDLSPRGLLVFMGTKDSIFQLWLGIRACDGSDEVCTFPGVSCPPTSVTINIQRNRINVTRGHTDVTILSTADFDATTVDPTTVFFGKTGTEASPTRVKIVDANKDRQKDLVLRFTNQDTGLQCGDTQGILKGETFDGQIIQGADSIVTVRCRHRAL